MKKFFIKLTALTAAMILAGPTALPLQARLTQAAGETVSSGTTSSAKGTASSGSSSTGTKSTSGNAASSANKETSGSAASSSSANKGTSGSTASSGSAASSSKTSGTTQKKTGTGTSKAQSQTSKKTTASSSAQTKTAAPAYAPVVTPATDVTPGLEMTFLTGENAMVHEAAVTNAFVAATQLIPNLTGRDNVLSMAGGVEPLSFYAVTFNGPSAEVSTPDRIDAVLQLTQVLNGRTLRVGETIRGVYEVDGLFYLADTRIEGQQVVVSVPHLVGAASVPVMNFIVGRGVWTPGAGIDYLAIGNSITMHPKRDYWPNAMGMGASSIDKDYFHLVTAGLEKKYGLDSGTLNAAAMNFAIWESKEGNRQYALTLLDPYLTPELELISIQLGENFEDQENFAAEYTQLVSYIRARCPAAQIVLVGTFWQKDVAEIVKVQVAQALGLSYVSLAPIQNKVDYMFGTGYAYDAAGNPYYSTNGGTALHPNNAAMRYIADGILAAFQ